MAKILLSESDVKALENGEIISVMIYGYLVGIQKDNRKPLKMNSSPHTNHKFYDIHVSTNLLHSK